MTSLHRTGHAQLNTSQVGRGTVHGGVINVTLAVADPGKMKGGFQTNERAARIFFVTPTSCHTD